MPKLSKTMKKLLTLLNAGKSNAQIAVELDISEHTVKVHCWRLFKCIGVASRLEAAKWWRDGCLRHPVRGDVLMSNYSATMGPTLTNPNALDTVAELRAALDQANTQALQMSELMHRNACVLTRVTDELRKLLTLHIEHDTVGVRDLLSELARKYARPIPLGQMH